MVVGVGEAVEAEAPELLGVTPSVREEVGVAEGVEDSDAELLLERTGESVVLLVGVGVPEPVGERVEVGVGVGLLDPEDVEEVEAVGTAAFELEGVEPVVREAVGEEEGVEDSDAELLP